ncbi:hypothetical protein EAI_16854, partial [Harpegnathos saltator]
LVLKLNKWVSHVLNEKDNLDRISKCVTLLKRHCNETFFNQLTTCDEKSIFYHMV